MLRLETRILSMTAEVKSHHLVSLLWGYAALGIQPTEGMKEMLQCKVLEKVKELT